MRPYIVIFVTQSVDGKIASVDGFSKLSCPEDKLRQYWLRSKVDGVLVGANTVISDDPRLYPKIFGRHGKYYRVVIDGLLRSPVSARIFDVSEYGTIVLTTGCAPREKIAELRSRGVYVEVVSSKPPIDIGKAVEVLHKEYGIESVLVEGGGETIWSFVERRLFDEFRVTVSPKIFGGKSAVSSVGGRGFRGLEAVDLELVLVGICKCLSEVHLVYRNPRPSTPPCRYVELGTYDNFWRKIEISR